MALILLLLSACTSVPSLEDSPNALSKPPESNFAVAKSELPPVNPQPVPPAASSNAPAQPAAAAPASTSTIEPSETASAARITPTPGATEPDSQAAATDPQSLEEEDQIAVANAEPAPREVADGQYEAYYSSEGIEVYSGGGDMCIGRKAGSAGKLKAGAVLAIACSDDRMGTIKVDRMLDSATAEAKLKIGSSAPQKIQITIQR